MNTPNDNYTTRCQHKSVKPVIVKQGIGVLSALGIIFIVLKTIDVIDWSWWLVLLPFYGPTLLGVIMVLGIILIIKR